MDTTTENPIRKTENHRGSQHLRVGLEIQTESVRVVSMWLVDQPSVQFTRLVNPILARVDIAGQPILVEAFADPRITRGTYRPQVGHSFRAEASGVIHVSVPFNDLRELADVRIRVIDATSAGPSNHDPATVASVFDKLPESAAVLADIDTATLSKHPDWAGIVAHVDPARARFEIYVDDSKRFGWRLRGPKGEIIAQSVTVHATKEACADEISWVQAQAGQLPVVVVGSSDEKKN